MRGAARREPVALVLGLVGLVAAVMGVLRTGDLPGLDDQAAFGVVCAFAVTIVVGEWFHLSAPGFRGSAPIAMAAAFGLALTTEIPSGSHVTYGSVLVIAATAGSLAGRSTRTTHRLLGRARRSSGGARCWTGDLSRAAGDAALLWERHSSVRFLTRTAEALD